VESPTRDEWGCNIENAFDNQIRITRSVTGRVVKCGDDGEKGGAFGERRVSRDVNKESFTDGGVLVNYNWSSLLTDV